MKATTTAIMSAAWLVAGKSPKRATIAENERVSSFVVAITEENAPAPFTSIAVTKSKISSAHKVQGVVSIVSRPNRRLNAAYSKPNSTPIGAIHPQPGVSLSNTLAVWGADRPYKTRATKTIQYDTLSAM